MLKKLTIAWLFKIEAISKYKSRSKIILMLKKLNIGWLLKIEAITKYKSEITTIFNQVKKSNSQKYNVLKNQQAQWLKNTEKTCENSQVHYTYCMLGEYDERLTKLKKQLKN